MNLCAKCKGKGMCGLSRCPITERFREHTKRIKAQDYAGSSPSPFVGSYNYPNVNSGPLLIDDNCSPSDWMKKGFSIQDIVSVRAQTIRGGSVKKVYTGSIQEIALSVSPLDVEVSFEKPVSFDLRFDGVMAPVGLSGALKSMDVIDNAKVPRVVDKITSDTDISATDACQELFSGGTDLYQIIQLMSTGLVGKKRKLVPTRWAITAVDDTVGKELKKQVFRYPPLEYIQIFYAKRFGNSIACILIPGDWVYEMIEIWGKNSLWGGESESVAQDMENHKKSSYSPIAGAYYSSRLAVLEYLQSIRRSARVLVVRHVSNEYWAPLGTWVIREVTRQAMNNKPLVCGSLPDAINEVSMRLGFSSWKTHSKLIPLVKNQKTLFDFF